MIYLILSILFSTSLFVIFKYFTIYKVNTLQAIVVNYVVAFTLGMFSANAFGKISVVNEQPWFYGALYLGILFVFVFLVMALTSQKNGVSIASVAGKMSVVVPIFFGIILYNERITLLKIVGVSIALIAVYLSSVKEKKENQSKASLLFPVLLFLGSGIIDTALKYIEINFVPRDQVAFFSGSLFGVAGVFGVLIILCKQFISREKIALKSIIAGVALGVPNYFSIVFLIKALQNATIESATLFTINNVGVVVISTIVGLFLFKENFSTKNKVGIVLAVIGIVIVTIA